MSSNQHEQVNESARMAIGACVVGVVILAGLLRFVGLDEVPPAINQDEASRGYEAYCLSKTGMDHYGEPWPIFFRGFGALDYPPGTYIYSLIPVQALFGMSVWSTRLPAALLGTLNVWFLYLLVSHLYNRRAGLLAGLFLAVSPWHMHISRLAFEASLCPPLVTLGLYLLVRCSGKEDEPVGSPVRVKDLVGLVIAGLAMGIALWTYNAFRVVVPLLLMGGGLLYFFSIRVFLRRQRGWYGAGLFLGGFLAALAPFLWVTVKNPEQAWARLAIADVAQKSTTGAEMLGTLIHDYAMHFSPSYLFLEGDDIPIQSVDGYGELHYYCALLLPLGLYRIIRQRKGERFGWFLLWWILIAPIPSAVTTPNQGHCLRSAGVLPAYQIVAAIGLDMLLCAAGRFSKVIYRFGLGVALAVVALNTGYFVYLFSVKYPPAVAHHFQAEWAEVFREIRERESGYDVVALTDNGSNQLGILYLFWNKIHPEQYFKWRCRFYKGPSWDIMIQMGKTYFVSFSQLRSFSAELPANPKILVAERAGIKIPGREIKRFHDPEGEIAVILYHVEVTIRKKSRTNQTPTHQQQSVPGS
ncbi:MAG: ArnT family glycosyltransferase [Planctomycetota bacterium]|jgi:4-amino-4-deoxy-L-arabinose transferase-like glycosyltransferase